MRRERRRRDGKEAGTETEDLKSLTLAQETFLELGDPEAKHRYMLFHLFILAIISFI